MQPVDSSRTRNRTRVLMTGTVFTPHGAHKVLIRDISPTGAQVIAKSPLPKQCDALFKRGTVFAAAYVAWSKDNEAGLSFYRELTDQEVELDLPPRGPARRVLTGTAAS